MLVQGDSGGPLIVPDDSSPVGFVVAGIASWGNGCAQPTAMGMYARVSYFEDWIEDNSGLTFSAPIIFHDFFFATDMIVDSGFYTGQIILSSGITITIPENGIMVIDGNVSTTGTRSTIRV